MKNQKEEKGSGSFSTSSTVKSGCLSCVWYIWYGVAESQMVETCGLYDLLLHGKAFVLAWRERCGEMQR